MVPCWQDFEDCTDKVLSAPFTFEFLYMERRMDGLTRPADKYMYRIILVASKKKKWMKEEVPKIEDWVEMMNEVFI